MVFSGNYEVRTLNINDLYGDKQEIIGLDKLQQAQEEGKYVMTYEAFMEVLGIEREDR